MIKVLLLLPSTKRSDNGLITWLACLIYFYRVMRKEWEEGELQNQSIPPKIEFIYLVFLTLLSCRLRSSRDAFQPPHSVRRRMEKCEQRGTRRTQKEILISRRQLCAMPHSEWRARDSQSKTHTHTIKTRAWSSASSSFLVGQIKMKHQKGERQEGEEGFELPSKRCSASPSRQLDMLFCHLAFPEIESLKLREGWSM